MISYTFLKYNFTILFFLSMSVRVQLQGKDKNSRRNFHRNEKNIINHYVHCEYCQVPDSTCSS